MKNKLSGIIYHITLTIKWIFFFITPVCFGIKHTGCMLFSNLLPEIAPQGLQHGNATENRKLFVRAFE